MFIFKKNRNGSISIPIIDKTCGSYKVIKSFGNAITGEKIAGLYAEANLYLQRKQQQQSLFASQTDLWLRTFYERLRIKNSV